MGRFTWQMRRKEESCREIIRALISQGPQSYTNLLHITNLSRAVLAKRLADLRESGNIEKFLTIEGNVHYRLTHKAVEDYLHFFKLAHFSGGFFLLFQPISKMTDDTSITTKEFLESFAKKIGVFSLYMFMHILSMEDPEEARLWLRTSFANIKQKRRWLWYLLERVNIAERKKPVVMEDDLADMSKMLSYIRNPIALSKMRTALKELFHEEAQILDLRIKEASAWASILTAFQKGELDKEFMNFPINEIYKRYEEVKRKRSKID